MIYPKPGHYIVDFLGQQFEEPIEDPIGPNTARVRFQENMAMIDHQQLNTQSRQRKDRLDHFQQLLFDNLKQQDKQITET